jgi:hypothetical protein
MYPRQPDLRQAPCYLARKKGGPMHTSYRNGDWVIRSNNPVFMGT